MHSFRAAVAVFPFAASCLAALAQNEPAKPLYPNYPSETPQELQTATATFDYARREAMIPMRDGVKLHTVILVPKGAQPRADPAHAHALRRRQLTSHTPARTSAMLTAMTTPPT